MGTPITRAPVIAGYLATTSAAPVMRHRLGDIALETISYGASQRIGDATVSFHPAGHVPGSAQIRVEVGGEVWVASGDYKVEADGLSEPFEPVKCHAFITECTFGLPVFKWDAQADVIAAINDWWRGNRDAGRFSVLGAYALGKAQRIIANVDAGIGPILTHGAIENTNEVLRAQGYALPPTVRVTAETDAKAHAGALVIATPSAMGGPWMKRFGAGVHRLRLRLDADARRAAAPVRRPGLCDVGPCRLGRVEHRDPRDQRGADIRDARLYLGLFPLAHGTGL